MIIRRQQMDAFERVSAKGFEARTYVHLQQWFPHHCKLLGEAQIRVAILYGWQKAVSYNLTAECCVRSYITLVQNSFFELS